MPGIGIPRLEETLPPISRRNYGKWVSHVHVKPGVVRHDSSTGESCYTVRAGMPPNARVGKPLLLAICDLADEFSEGYFRVTQRNALEFVGVAAERIEELIGRLGEVGLPVGGTGRTLRNFVCCTGWIHCHLAASDPAAIMKVLGDELYEYFTTEKLPAKVKISGSGCINNCGEGSTADIGIVAVHRDFPPVKTEKLKGCELPLVAAVCPTGAIQLRGKDEVSINEALCIHCPACSTACAAMAPLGTAEGDGVAIVVGGKASSSGVGPQIAKVVIPYLPNRPPRFPEVVDAVKRILFAWAKDALPDERVADWIARIGWKNFFKRTAIPFNRKIIDGYDPRSLEYARARASF